jgi:hypothetical protein
MPTRQVKYKHPKVDQFNELDRIRDTVPNAIGVASQRCEDEGYVYIVYEVVIREPVPLREQGEDGVDYNKPDFGPLIRVNRW